MKNFRVQKESRRSRVYDLDEEGRRGLQHLFNRLKVKGVVLVVGPKSETLKKEIEKLSPPVLRASAVDSSRQATPEQLRDVDVLVINTTWPSSSTAFLSVPIGEAPRPTTAPAASTATKGGGKPTTERKGTAPPPTTSEPFDAILSKLEETPNVMLPAFVVVISDGLHLEQTSKHVTETYDYTLYRAALRPSMQNELRFVTFQRTTEETSGVSKQSPTAPATPLTASSPPVSLAAAATAASS